MLTEACQHATVQRHTKIMDINDSQHLQCLFERDTGIRMSRNAYYPLVFRDDYLNEHVNSLLEVVSLWEEKGSLSMLNALK